MVDDELTERERTAAILLAYGHTNRDVARELRRVDAHGRRRAGAPDAEARVRASRELVRWALERDLLH